MDHIYIEEQQIAERYVMGRLPETEEERFEAHYLTCPECRARLAVVKSMVRGFKRATIQNAAQFAAARQLAIVTWLSRLGRSRQLAALFLVPFFVLIGPGLLTLRLGEVGQQLAETRSALERQQMAVKELKQQEKAWTDEHRTESFVLLKERQAHAQERQILSQLREQLAEAQKPQAVIALALDVARGAGPGNDDSSHRLLLPKKPRMISLSFRIDDPNALSYRAVLHGPEGKLWTIGGLQPDAEKRLTVAFLSTLLTRPGVYRVVVEGISPDRKPVQAGPFRFSVLPSA